MSARRPVSIAGRDVIGSRDGGGASLSSRYISHNFLIRLTRRAPRPRATYNTISHDTSVRPSVRQAAERRIVGSFVSFMFLNQFSDRRAPAAIVVAFPRYASIPARLVNTQLSSIAA